MFLLFLFDLEGLGPLPTHPQVGSKPMQFTLKNYLVGQIDFNVFEKKVLRRERGLKA